MAKLSSKAKKWISDKISKLAHEGYKDPNQRSAIAYSMARKKKYDVPESPSKFKKIRKMMKK